MRSERPSLPVKLIAAVSRNGCLADDSGRIPWRCAADTAQFRAAVAGQWLLLGRRTAEQMRGWFQEMRAGPGPVRPIILSSQPPGAGFPADSVWVASVAEALDCAARGGAEGLWCGGGGQVYAQALSFADELILSEIDVELASGTLFPCRDASQWRLAGERTLQPSPGDTHTAVWRRWLRVRSASSDTSASCIPST